MSGAVSTATLLALACGVLAVIYGLVSSKWILGLDAGNAKMQAIAAAILRAAGRSRQ